MTTLVRHAMTESPHTLGPDMNAADAAGLMKQLDVGVIPVTDGENLLGLVTESPATGEVSDSPPRGTPERARKTRRR